ncbi:hypothetical protein D3C86_1832300 [compost metagenome]
MAAFAPLISVLQRHLGLTAIAQQEKRVCQALVNAGAIADMDFQTIVEVAGSCGEACLAPA